MNTIGDLLYTLPLRHIDRSRIVPIAELHNYIGQQVSVVGIIVQSRIDSGSRRKYRIQIQDASGNLEALWFSGIGHLQHILAVGRRLLFSGKVQKYNHIQMVHPSIESLPNDAEAPDDPFLPRYSLSYDMREAGIGQAVLIKSIKWVLAHCTNWPRVLPDLLETAHSFPPLKTCLSRLHFPLMHNDLDTHTPRLAYEELWQLAVGLRWSRRKFELPGRSLQPGSLAEQLRASLPFKLSDDQSAAISTLHADSAAPRRMHRLLLGDVGSGKTITAVFACLPALNSGLQVAWLAPTEILARQSFIQIAAYLEPLGFPVSLLTSSTDYDDRRAVITGLASKAIRVLVGTHSLMQPTIRFSGIGQIVIDEQHKFGVDQRKALQMKDPAADFLLLSATPIPQTLAETIYGDLEPVVIRTAHLGRGNVSTRIVPAHKRSDMLSFIAAELVKGDNRVFFVCPRIASEAEDGPDGIDLVAAELAKSPLASHGIAIIHGRLKADQREEIMADFSAGKYKILVATTVIEVGIDIRQATCIVIEGAAWFGLSQLHQLRGRVGRDGREAWCFLLPADTDSDETLERLRRFSTTDDGFAIAELDLELRGPGQVGGMQQTGYSDLRFADILRDAAWFKEINSQVKTMLVD